MALRFIPAVHRATHRIGVHIGRLERGLITQGEAHILAHLLESPDATIADVHRAFGHKRSTLTSILDRLEARRLVTRRTNPRDRRTFLVGLTRDGREAARAVSAHLEAFEARVLKRASPKDIKAFLRVLDAVDAALE
jgi:DNA-binding MarR family transcriptional regulator